MDINVDGLVPEWSMADRLRKARELTGLDQTEFADEIGVSRGTVSRYERGEATAKRPILTVWAMRTGVPLTWLTTGAAPGFVPDLMQAAYLAQSMMAAR